MAKFPDLPIVTPDPPRKSQAEKYGGLLYLGVGGLVVLLALVAWFAHGVWSLRSVWADIYTVNDPRAPEARRIEAAWRLARDPRVTDRQRWDLALSKTPPDLARYLLAESLTSGATEADTRAYGLAVARSEGWPDWLRVLLARPLAYEAAGGGNPHREALREITRRSDPFVALWAHAALTLASPSDGDRESLKALTDASVSSEPTREFAECLRDAVGSSQPRRTEALDRATHILRRDHPGASPLWRGWREGPAGIDRVAAPELPPSRR